ncbi:hypothetical protein [Massilia agri]|uniref:Uncharacterized protein n=1 Tax=Massilia agri TaxID=1886785 RepID=A0ABT2AK07_9BURK|nr:hypothetical protein [Massilia agri]MCS0596572.1 hypothetical protein [Massilia agri]
MNVPPDKYEEEDEMATLSYQYRFWTARTQISIVQPTKTVEKLDSPLASSIHALDLAGIFSMAQVLLSIDNNQICQFLTATVVTTKEKP